MTRMQYVRVRNKHFLYTYSQCESVCVFTVHTCAIGEVRVGGEAGYLQCDTFTCDIEHHCCLSGRDTILLNPEMSPTASPLVRYFSVLGEGPPSVSWDVVWFNHYPVSLQLEVEEEGYHNNRLAKVRQCLSLLPSLPSLYSIYAHNNEEQHCCRCLLVPTK